MIIGKLLGLALGITALFVGVTEGLREYDYQFKIETGTHGESETSSQESRLSVEGLARITELNEHGLHSMNLENVQFKGNAGESVGIRDGKILSDWFEEKEIIYSVDQTRKVNGVVQIPETEMSWVYKGLVSALQTHTSDVRANEDGMIAATITDVTGTHYVDVLRNRDEGTVTMTFTEDHQIRFADSRVDKSKLDFDGVSIHWLHPSEPGISSRIVLTHQGVSKTEEIVVGSSGRIELKLVGEIRNLDVGSRYQASLEMRVNPDLSLTLDKRELGIEDEDEVKEGSQTLDYDKPDLESRWMVAEGLTTDPQFPYNKQGSKTVNIGPKDLSVDISAGYFAGTNFNGCHGKSTSTDLNYKIGGSVKATVNVFGFHKTVFDMETWYAAMSGATTQNQFTVDVFGARVKNGEMLPGVSTKSCLPPTVKGIWSSSPSFSVGYTVVVVAVPVKFSVGVTAKLDLSYGYEVCPQDLKASVFIQPSLTLQASAGASVSAVIARAGVELVGSINAKLQPTAWININQCQMGLEVDRISDPTTLTFDAYYQTRSCHFHHWHLSCGWGGKHEHPFWKWSSSGSRGTLWKEVCTYDSTRHPEIYC